MVLKTRERISIAEGFYLDELVPEYLYRQHIANNERFLRSLYDKRLLDILVVLRRNLQTPITINNWATGGDRQWSCVRTPVSPYYSAGSQHTCIITNGVVQVKGRAVDCLFGNLTAAQARKHITDNWSLIYKPLGISRLEDDVSWLHFDLKPTGLNRIVTFKP